MNAPAPAEAPVRRRQPAAQIRPRLLVVLAGALTVGACAPRSTTVALPSGPGVALPAAEAEALATAVAAPCQAIAALTADLRVGGRVDGERVRGTLQLGVDADAVRIEGVPPFGAPLFILAGRADAATLLFVRDNAYIAETPVTALTDALVGLPLGPAELKALVGGCGLPPRGVRSGAILADRWVRLDLEDGARLWLSRASPDGRPVLRVAETSGWRLDYADPTVGAPLRGTLVAADRRSPGTTLTFEVVAPETLPALPTAALDIVIPATARRVPLAELRRQRVLAAS